MSTEHETRLAAAVEQFLAAMIAEGRTRERAVARCHELITDSLISFRRSAAVQALRKALRVVGDVQPGDGAAAQS